MGNEESGHIKQSPPATTAEEGTTAEKLRALAESTGVGSIMSRSVVCLAPEAEVHAVTEMFLDRDFSSAPVVDQRWLPMAVVSKTDLLRFFSTGQKAESSLRHTPRPGAPGPRLFWPESSPQAPPPQRPHVAAAAAGAEGRPPGGEVEVQDVTVPYVLSLHEEAPISVAAALMAYEGVHRLPIVSTGGEVVGVVSTLDIVRWLAEATGVGPEALG